MKKLALLLAILFSLTVGAAATHGEELLTKTFVMDDYSNSEVSLFSQPVVFKDYPGLVEDVIQAWENMDTELDISKYEININDIANLYFNIYHQNPYYYYVQRAFNCSYGEISGKVAVLKLGYTETDKEKIAEQLRLIDEATDEILLSIDDGMTDFEKVMAVHDYMVLNYEYDTTLENHLITIMTTKTGVCESYVYAFNHIMHILGIDSVYIDSDLMNHAWNLVKIDGEWYHIDLTWDDPTRDKYAQVSHAYALLSTEEIKSLDNPHYGFDLGSLSADSHKYDDAPWHEGVNSVVSIDNKTYWVEDFDIKCSDGKDVYENLADSDGKWNLNERSYFPTCMTGLAAYGHKLYFNTDTAIMCYDTVTGDLETVQSVSGTCGLFIHNNVLNYNKFENNRFSYCGSVTLDEVVFSNPHIEDGQIVIRIFNDSEDSLLVFYSGTDHIDNKLIENTGISKVTFDPDKAGEVFLWTKDFRPIAPKMSISAE